MQKRKNFIARLSYLIWHSDLEATRLCLALGSLLWAALLLWPGTLFTPGRQTYAVMASIASEELWGVAFLIQGTVMLFSLFNGHKSKLFFVVDALLGCLLWTASTWACFLAHFESIDTYQPPAAMAYELIGAIASWWCFVRYSFSRGK